MAEALGAMLSLDPELASQFKFLMFVSGFLPGEVAFDPPLATPSLHIWGEADDIVPNDVCGVIFL